MIVGSLMSCQLETWMIPVLKLKKDPEEKVIDSTALFNSVVDNPLSALTHSYLCLSVIHIMKSL